MKKFARIQSIELENFKNIGHGYVDFASYGKESNDYSPNITAIYGQNGSGKTALINAIELMKSLVLGQMLPLDIKKYIKAGEEFCSITISLYLKDEISTDIVSYKFVLREIDNNVVVSEESVKAQDNVLGEFGNFSKIITYDCQNQINNGGGIGFEITPKYLQKELLQKGFGLFLAQSLSQRVNPNTQNPESTSFIFSNNFLTLLDSNSENQRKLKRILQKIQNFVNNDLMIINDSTFGGISENIHAIPIFTKSPIKQIHGVDCNGFAVGCLPIDIYDKTTVPEILFPVYENFEKQINMVLPYIIPNIKVKITSKEKTLMENGDMGISFEIATLRNEKEIGLKYESAGIKKILCILSSLIATYNNYDMCFVVDELDSGIFEYLLGQIINVFKHDAKGQLIFTSHNLHVVELLDNSSLVFTNSNENNCYFHLPNVKANNNKRMLYMRMLELSDENDIVYNSTNQYEMSFAFENAYDVFEEGDMVE